MTDIVSKYSHVWGNDPQTLLNKYKYHPELTKKLDEISADDFNQEILFEIVLWKLSRYPYINPDMLEELKGVAKLEPKQHRQSELILKKLLLSSGVRLPMASTILRFLNPKVFQIIDDRVYRVLLPGKRIYPAKPAKPASEARMKSYISNSVKIYFDYLDAMHNASSEKLPFELADRILYQLDIELENKIGAKS